MFATRTTIHLDTNRSKARLRWGGLMPRSLARLAVCFLLTLTAASTTTPAQRCVFVEDFASGTLGSWTLSGRQKGAWTAKVVSRGGSPAAHLYHRGFTEITIRRRFAYHKAMRFIFKMETAVRGGNGPTSNIYQSAGAVFEFMDATGKVLGRVWYHASTSSFPNVCCKGPTKAHVQLRPGVRNYAVTSEQLLKQISINSTKITRVDLAFFSYASSSGYSLSGDLWRYNVLVLGSKGPCATATKVGKGCIANGQPPVLSGTPPALGNTAQVFVRGAPQNALGMNLVGAPHKGITLGASCQLYVDLALPIIPLAFRTDSTGSWQLPRVVIPTSPALLGRMIAWQAGVSHELTYPLGVALTNGLRLTVGH